jgi:hypothetical protein
VIQAKAKPKVKPKLDPLPYGLRFVAESGHVLVMPAAAPHLADFATPGPLHSGYAPALYVGVLADPLGFESWGQE